MNTLKGRSDNRSMMVHVAGAGVGLALAGALYVGVIRPVHSARSNAIQQRTAVAELTDELSSVESDINSTRAQIAALEKQLDHSVQLQDPSRLNRYVTEVMRLATDSKLSVLEAPQGDYRPAHPDYGRVPIALQGTGQPADVLAFLDKLHEACRDIEVVGVELAASGGGDGGGLYRVEMEWYTLPVHRGAAPTGDGSKFPGGADEADRSGTRQENSAAGG
jgi:hypothetical protein